MSLILLIVAIVCAAVAFLIDFGLLFFEEGEPHALGWLAVGVFFYLLSLLPWGRVTDRSP